MPKWTKEQEEAINEKGKSIIVSAGAGSGKTAVLTERVCTHLKSGVKINELLIITFTNAAAAEMKNRIRKKIKEEESIKENLELIDSAPITTFDAYALKIVKDYSTALGISNELSIIDNTFIDIKKEEILKEIFEKHYRKKDPLFIELIDNFTLKDDKEIIDNILKIYKKIITKYDKKEFFKDYIKNNYNENNLNNYRKEYEKYLLEKVQDIKKICKELEFQIEGNYTQKINNTLQNLYLSETYEDIKRNADITLPRLPSGVSEEAKNTKKILTEKLKELKELTKYSNKEEIEETLLSTKNNVEVIINLLKELDEELEKYKKGKNIYEFSDISNMAIQILSNNKDIREKLRNQYYEILVDEYQDTNDAQEKFISLIEKNNVYMVGDIKQSIYRFRNTNPKLFKKKYNEYSKKEKGIKIDLNKNFRSRKEVLTGVNKIFDQIMSENVGGANYKESHRMIFGNNTYLENNVENYNLEILNYQDEEEYSKEEIEIFAIAKDIKEKIKKGYEIIDKDTWKPRKVKYDDFAILIDRSSSFNRYKKIFEYLNIPLNVYREQTITESKDLLILANIYSLIINIYNAAQNKDFKYSYVSVARSYLYEINDTEILKTIGKIKETEIYKNCYELAKNIETKTNYELVEEIYEKFNIYQNIIKDGNIDEHIIVLDSIKEIAKNMDILGITPEEFKEYLRYIIKKGLDIKVKTNKMNDKSVKIMTIHASKGLEFPICYYSGLSKEFNLQDLKNKFYYSEQYGIIAPYYNNGPKNSILKILLKKDYIKEEVSERLRLFYVALTRAREKMIIVTSLDEDDTQIDDNSKLEYKSFKSVIDSVSPALKEYTKNIDNDKIGLTKDYNYISKKPLKIKEESNYSLLVNEIEIKKEEIENSNYSKQIKNIINKAEYTNIEKGKKMHKIFEDFDFLNPDYSNLNEYEKSKIKAFMSTNILEEVKEIYKEYEFITEEDNHGIIDLLLVKEDKNIIIDYKLKNIEAKEYVKQLNGYQKYIKDITNKPTEIYLYSIIDEKLSKI